MVLSNSKWGNHPQLGYIELDITNRVLAETEYNTLKTIAIRWRNAEKTIVYIMLKTAMLIKGARV